MKPLERIFFQACWMQCIVHRVDGMDKDPTTCKFLRDIVDIFHSMGFPNKRLWWYLEKWNDIGFYDYGVALDLGWFEENKLTAEYKVLAEQAEKYYG